jgi:predicted transcriptional regulator of viral defense system
MHNIEVYMRNNIRDVLENWPKFFIKDSDLAKILNKSDNARYSIVKRALKSGALVHIRKGLYLIASKTKQGFLDEFELALFIYEPSIVSLESALSYHNWIPEAVYTATCVSPRRSQEFKTPIGIFSYKHVPEECFYMGVGRISTKNGVIFIAEPWRALADFIYTAHKTWENLAQLEEDLRIDADTIVDSDKQLLKLLIECYPSPRVRKILKRFYKEIDQKS